VYWGVNIGKSRRIAIDDAILITLKPFAAVYGRGRLRRRQCQLAEHTQSARAATAGDAEELAGEFAVSGTQISPAIRARQTTQPLLLKIRAGLD